LSGDGGLDRSLLQRNEAWLARVSAMRDNAHAALEARRTAQIRCRQRISGTADAADRFEVTAGLSQ